MVFFSEIPTRHSKKTDVNRKILSAVVINHESDDADWTFPCDTPPTAFVFIRYGVAYLTIQKAYEHVKAQGHTVNRLDVFQKTRIPTVYI
jgi:hypothetical protein